MSREKIKADLQVIFQDVLDNPNIVLQDHYAAADLEGWDSMAHINLVSAIEKLYQIRFSLGELDELKTVGDMLSMVEKKLTKRSNA